MQLTNDLKLPSPIVNAVRDDGYDKGHCDFTVTELISPVRIRALRKKWSEHLVEDASDRIFSLFGKAMHKVLEQAADPRYCMVEKRYYADFDISGDTQHPDNIELYRVSGQFDLYDYVLDREMNLLSDYKFTSRYTVANGVKPEHEAQLNCNALLMRKNGITVNGLQIVAIFRDWSKMAANRSDDYPQKQIAILLVEMWPKEKTEAFIRERVKAHIEGEVHPPVCTPEERWRKPDQWALMKKGAKRATKLYDTEIEAGNVAQLDSKYYVEPRPGEDTRCLFYCGVNKFCSYYQGLMMEKTAVKQ